MLTGSLMIYLIHYVTFRYFIMSQFWGLPWLLSGEKKKLPANAGDASLIPGLGRSPGQKEMATHFSMLAWIIPWTEEPGGLQSIGLQRIRHD